LSCSCSVEHPHIDIKVRPTRHTRDVDILTCLPLTRAQPTRPLSLWGAHSPHTHTLTTYNTPDRQKEEEYPHTHPQHERRTTRQTHTARKPR